MALARRPKTFDYEEEEEEDDVMVIGIDFGTT
jgi:hypothetical protein